MANVANECAAHFTLVNSIRDDLPSYAALHIKTWTHDYVDASYQNTYWVLKAYA